MATEPDLNLLLRQMAKGDMTAFEAFYRQVERPLFRFIASRLNDPFQCADILHEVFLDVWAGAGRFEGRSSVKSWVFGIAFRKVIDHFRKQGRLTTDEDLPEQEDDSPDALTCIAATQEAAHVRACLEDLKPDHRTAIELTFFEDMGYREIAEALEVPEGTVKTRVFHAKKLLMHCLEGRLRARGR